MTGPNPFRRAKVADRLADPLAGITIAEAPAIVVDHARFATFTPDRFGTPDRFANHGRFTATDPDKAAKADGRFRANVNRFTQPRDIVIVPQQPPGGQLLTISSQEYLDCYLDEEGQLTDVIWYPGEVINFSRAAVARYEESGARKKDAVLYAAGINSARDLLDPKYDPSQEWLESDLWDEVLKMTEIFHDQLRKDAHWAATGLDVFDLDILQRITGRRHIPFHEDVENAIEDDPYTGLGAAALDYAAWEVAAQYDRDWGIEQAKGLLQCTEDDGFRRPFSVQHFVLSAGRLHPGSRKLPAEGSRPDCYELYGSYAVAGVEYVADTTFQCLGGYRLLYLEPVGSPERPKFRE